MLREYLLVAGVWRVLLVTFGSLPVSFIDFRSF